MSTKSAGATSASSQVEATTVRLERLGICPLIPSEGSTAVTQTSRTAIATARHGQASVHALVGGSSMAVAERELTPERFEFTADEARLLERYFTNLDRPVFALRNLPEVVKGALFSRYSRTEKSLRRVLLEEFLNQPGFGLEELLQPETPGDLVATRNAEEFYDRVCVCCGDDAGAELAGAHLAVERVSTLAAKALEDSRIGLAPLEKSTRYVRFDRPGPDGRFLYHRGPELQSRYYELACDHLFQTFSDLLVQVLDRVRGEFPIDPGETERAWKAATRAKALDLLRGLLPAATFTNLGLYGNG